MKRLRKIALYAVAAIAVFALSFVIPYTEHLDGPRSAILAESPVDTKFGLSVYWYDRGLNAERFHRELDFGADGSAVLPAYTIPTSLGRVLLKRVLTRFGAWTACEHCYGPTAICSLFHKTPYTQPDKMRLAQNSTEVAGIVTFRVSMLPDERKFVERTFAPADIPALLAESRAFTAKGDLAFIDPSAYGPVLRLLNPVRVETHGGALLLWMGGKVGYAVVPDSDGCPAINLTMISPTDDEHIYRIQKL
jgi:hypothetical protein